MDFKETAKNYLLRFRAADVIDAHTVALKSQTAEEFQYNLNKLTDSIRDLKRSLDKWAPST